MHFHSASIACAIVLAFAAQARGQDARVFASNSASGQLLQVTFDPPSATTINGDADQRTDLRSLAIRDDGVGGLHLIVCDKLGGAVVDYAGVANGATIVSAGSGGPQFPDGVSLDPTGNLAIASSDPDGIDASQMWIVLRDLGDAAGHTALPGGYRTPLGLLDGNVNALTEIGGVPTWVALERLEQTLRVGKTESALSAGDILVVCSKPAMVVHYPAGGVNEFLAALRAQTEPGSPPPELCPEVFIHPPQSSVSPLRRFPEGAQPTGIAFGPDGSLLIPTSDGKVLLFGPDGQRRTDTVGDVVDFTTSLSDGRHQIAVGPEDGRFRAYLSDETGSELLRFTIEADGTGTLDAIVSGNVHGPVGIAATTTVTVPTPVGNNVKIHPAVVLDTTFMQVVSDGVTNGKMVLFEDPREKELAIPAGEPLHRSLFLNEISDDLPAIEIPPYVRAFPLGDPDTGPPTFILVELESNATFSGPITQDSEESTVLGYEPDCDATDNFLRPRMFWAPTPDEIPILEGARFIDVTVDCGSNRGLIRNTLSLFLAGCRDTRAPVEIARTKLDALQQRFGDATCVKKKLRAALEQKLTSARRKFDRHRYAAAARDLAAFEKLIADHLDGFGSCDDTLSSELFSRSASARFTIGLL